ncbi:MAG: response regulator [Xanthomarina sp.]
MYKILVVDDDRIIGEMLKFMLSSKGYFALISNRPEETTRNIIDHKIDLVILDQFIFGVSGMNVCKQLKENESTGHVPVLMMSADISVAEMCLAAGASDFMAKPFEMKTLFSKIEAILKETNPSK